MIEMIQKENKNGLSHFKYYCFYYSKKFISNKIAMGLFIRDNPKMNYKATFGPSEILIQNFLNDQSSSSQLKFSYIPHAKLDEYIENKNKIRDTKDMTSLLSTICSNKDSRFLQCIKVKFKEKVMTFNDFFSEIFLNLKNLDNLKLNFEKYE